MTSEAKGGTNGKKPRDYGKVVPPQNQLREAKSDVKKVVDAASNKLEDSGAAISGLKPQVAESDQYSRSLKH